MGLVANSLWGKSTLVPISSLYSLYVVQESKEYEDVLYSVERIGLEYPVVALKCTVQEWYDTAWNENDFHKPPADLPRDQEVLLVMCGNQRLHAAQELGYDRISTIICTDKQEINELCGTMRDYWRKINSTS